LSVSVLRQAEGAGIVRIAAGRTPALEIKTSELDFVPAPEEPWVEALPTEQRYAVSELLWSYD
jgi:hypothetical protein